MDADVDLDVGVDVAVDVECCMCVCVCVLPFSLNSVTRIARIARDCTMQAVLRTSRGEARDPASSVEQHAETFSSIADVNAWLTVQCAVCNTLVLQKLRAAVSVLTKTPRPRHDEVSSICSSWNVRQKDDKQRRPLATLITELKEAVITEASRLRASLDSKTGATASSAEQPAETFSSIGHVHQWLTVQDASRNKPDLQKLRAAVSMLTQTRCLRWDELLPLCSTWHVRQNDQKRR